MKNIYRGMQNAAEDIQANFAELDNRKSKVLWKGSAKQGAQIPLNDSVQNYSVLALVISFGSGYHTSFFLPGDATANCVGTNIYNSLSTTVSICKYMIQKTDDKNYIVSVGRENSGTATAEGPEISGTVSLIVGIV